MTRLVELAHVAKSYGRNAVLEDVSLAVERGEIVTVVGPNGAGKSTLLRIVLGLERPTAGSVRLASGLRVGYQPQRLVVDDTLPLTVERFLALATRDRVAIASALAEVGVARTARHAVQTLSGGEWQRVLLARALLRDPDLLVLDEPVQGVDVTGQAELYDLVRRIRDRHRCGVLLVSHDLHLVMAATDHVVCLNRHVCCSGHPETVARHPAYRALFGPAAEAIAIYAHHHDHRHEPESEAQHG